MIKVAIPYRNNLNVKMIEEDERFEIIKDQDAADFILAQSTINRPDLLNKTIYVAAEAPLAVHRVWCYNRFDEFKLVVSHNCDYSKPNQIPFTLNKEDHFYQTYANAYPYTTREDTTMTKRGVFFAGMRGFYENANTFAINLTPMRTVLGEYFRDNFEGSKIIGRGWGNQTKKVDKWRSDKHEQIKNKEIDFVLALENTAYPGYVTEKIWDGIACDKVTLYLGAPNIEEFIPTTCFVDLRQWFDGESMTFDTDALGKFLREMTQEEYDNIIKAAREFRTGATGKYESLRTCLTERLMEFMCGEKDE